MHCISSRSLKKTNKLEKLPLPTSLGENAPAGWGTSITVDELAMKIQDNADQVVVLTQELASFKLNASATYAYVVTLRMLGDAAWLHTMCPSCMCTCIHTEENQVECEPPYQRL
jgi:hypothetical protein